MVKKKVNIIEEGLEDGESPIVKKLYDKFKKRYRRTSRMYQFNISKLG